MDDWDEAELWMRKEEKRALTPAGIAEQDRSLLRRYRESVTPRTPSPQHGAVIPTCAGLR